MTSKSECLFKKHAYYSENIDIQKTWIYIYI